jgi:uncharacterized protein (DUF111 family)
MFVKNSRHLVKHSPLANSPRSNEIEFEEDTVAVIESNVDDVTGEVLSEAVEKLIDAGAYDATVSSFLGKKGRMGQTIRTVCSPDAVLKFSQIIVEQTGTMGVKVQELRRLIVPRKEISVRIELGKFSGNVRVKVARIGDSMRFKPEFEEVKKIADAEKIPLRVVLDLVSNVARLQMKGENPT